MSNIIGYREIILQLETAFIPVSSSIPVFEGNVLACSIDVLTTPLHYSMFRVRAGFVSLSSPGALPFGNLLNSYINAVCGARWDGLAPMFPDMGLSLTVNGSAAATIIATFTIEDKRVK